MEWAPGYPFLGSLEIHAICGGLCPSFSPWKSPPGQAGGARSPGAESGSGYTPTQRPLPTPVPTGILSIASWRGICGLIHHTLEFKALAMTAALTILLTRSPSDRLAPGERASIFMLSVTGLAAWLPSCSWRFQSRGGEPTRKTSRRGSPERLGAVVRPEFLQGSP